MKIAIVVLNYNTKGEILDCLESLSKLQKDDNEIEIIIVDNASTDDSVSAIRKNFKDLTIVENQQNLGFSGGNNVGVKKTLKDKAEWFLILNPDTTVDDRLILELVKVANSDSLVGIIGPKIYFAKGLEFHKNRYKEGELGKVIWYAGGKIDWNNVLASHRGVDEVDKGHYQEIVETDFVSGAAMFVKSQVFEKIGFFDERYFLYLEDLEFCQRAKKAGFKVVFAPKAIVWHKNASSTKVGSPLQDYFITRNRLIFGLKYANLRAKFALFRESINFLFGSNKIKKRAVLDFYFGRWGRGRN